MFRIKVVYMHKNKMKWSDDGWYNKTLDFSSRSFSYRLHSWQVQLQSKEKSWFKKKNFLSIVAVV